MTEHRTPDPRRFAALVLLACCWAGVSANTLLAQPTTDENRVWRENSIGLVLDLPSGLSAPDKSPPPGALVRFVSEKGEDDFDITVSLKLYNDVIDVPVALQSAMPNRAAAVKLMDVSILEEPQLTKMSGRDAGKVYYWVADIRRTGREELKQVAPGVKKVPPKPWVLGQVFLQTGRFTMLVFELDVAENRFEEVKPLFEALCQSVRFETKRIDARREELVERFAEWRETVQVEQLHAARIDEQWRRVTDKGKDVGYVRVRQRATKKLNMPGIQVRIDTHLVRGDRSTDSDSDFFSSDDGDAEIWSIRMTDRPLHPAERARPKDLQLRLKKPDGKIVVRRGVAKEPGAVSWAETGMRDGDRIMVSRDSAAGTRKDERHALACYLSQVELYLLGQLAASAPWDDEIGFYAYFPTVGNVTFQTAKLERHHDGSYRLLIRPTPNSPVVISEYDADGRFKSLTTPDQRVVLPTDSSIVATWRKRP